MKKKYRIAGAGAGYFSVFQYRAWAERIDEAEVVAICNRNMDRARPLMDEFNISAHYKVYEEMLDKEKPDVVDIITPPETHLEMCKMAADRGIHIICQKPLAPDFETAEKIVQAVQGKGIRFMVHENWRFQPWYREMKKLMDEGIPGKVHSIYFRSRMGDGWGENAYIPRQPYFRDYPRFLIYENGIHFIDTFRYLLGEVNEVYASLRRINPVIKGEDAARVLFKFNSGVEVIWDANRYNESVYKNPRLTFGDCLLEGTKGSIRLDGNGKLFIKLLGEEEKEHAYEFSDREFAADCVYSTQRHFIDCMNSGAEFESNGEDYLRSLKVQEAVYESNAEGKIIHL